MGRVVGEEGNKKWHRKEGVQSKKWWPSRKFFYDVLSSATQSFISSWFLIKLWLYYSEKKSQFKKKSTSVSEITISYLHKNIIIPLLCQFRLFVSTCVSKNPIVSRDLIFYLLWCNAIRWSSHICKKSSFFSFSNFLVKFRE